jgi:hypothetical protein
MDPITKLDPRSADMTAGVMPSSGSMPPTHSELALDGRAEPLTRRQAGILPRFHVGLAFQAVVAGAALTGPVPAMGRPSVEGTQRWGAVAPAGQLTADAVAILETVSKQLDAPLPAASQRRDVGAWAPFMAARLMRPSNSERASPEAKQFFESLLGPLSEAVRCDLMGRFARLGAFSAQWPTEPTVYDTLLIQGTTVQGMRLRVLSLAQAIRAGRVIVTERTQVAFLEGERRLFAEETPDMMANPDPATRNPAWQPPARWPEDERDAAVLVWEQLDLPAALREAPIFFSHTALRPGNVRAHTVDCVADWARAVKSGASRAPGRILMVSEAPFIEYQALSTRLMLARAGLSADNLESMGDYDAERYAPLDETFKLGILLDNLAATLQRAQALQDLPRASSSSSAH